MKKKINVVQLVVASIISLGVVVTPIISEIMFGVDGLLFGFLSSVVIALLGVMLIVFVD